MTTTASLSGQGVLLDRTAYTRAALSGQGVLVGEVPHPLQPTLFDVTGYFNAVAGTSPVAQPINALITFTARLAAGQLIYVDDSVLTLGPLLAVIIDGILCDADNRTPGFQLPANTPQLNLAASGGSDGMGGLIYDCAFSLVTFGGANQLLPGFAFLAPVDATPICLTSSDLDSVPYQLPNQAQQPTPAQTYGRVLNSAGTRWAS
jgi:hypothetical protein